MFDVEIAAKFLNRLVASSQWRRCEHHIELLREGNLQFIRQLGRRDMSAGLQANEFDFGSILSANGSRAERIHALKGTRVSEPV